MIQHTFANSDKNNPVRFEATINREAGQDDFFISIMYHLDYLNLMDIALCGYPYVKIIGICCSVEGGEINIGGVSAFDGFTFELGKKLLDELERQAKSRDIIKLTGVFTLPSKYRDEIPKLFRNNGYEVGPVGAFQIRVLKNQNIQKDI